MASLVEPAYVRMHNANLLHLDRSVAEYGLYTCDVPDATFNFFRVQTPGGIQTVPAIEETDAFYQPGNHPMPAVWVCKDTTPYALNGLRQITSTYWYAELVKCELSEFGGLMARHNGTHILLLLPIDPDDFWGRPAYVKRINAVPTQTMYIRRRPTSSNPPSGFLWFFEIWEPFSFPGAILRARLWNSPDPGLDDIEGTYTGAQAGTVTISWPAGLV